MNKLKKDLDSEPLQIFMLELCNVVLFNRGMPAALGPESPTKDGAELPEIVGLVNVSYATHVWA